MNPGELLERLRSLDIEVIAQDGELEVEGPEEALTEDLLAQLREHKPTLLNLLRDDRMPPAVTDESLPALVESVGTRMQELGRVMGAYAEWVRHRDALLQDMDRMDAELQRQGRRIEDFGWTLGRGCRWQRLDEPQEGA